MILSETSISKIVELLVLNEIEDYGRISGLALRTGDRFSSGSEESKEFEGMSGHKFDVPNTAGRVFPVANFKGKSYKRSVTSPPSLKRKDPTGKTQEYRTHKGYDIGAPKGTPIVSIDDGVVVTSKTDSVSGNYVVIKHNDGSKSLYCHFAQPGIAQNTTVVKGQFIGFCGSTGRSTGPHLHFGFRPSGGSGYSTDAADYSWLWSAPEVVVTKSEDSAGGSSSVASGSTTGTITGYAGDGFMKASPEAIVAAAPGCSLDAARYALAAYQKFYGNISNKNKMCIVDYTRAGSQTRLWCLSVDGSGNVSSRVATDVSHGVGNSSSGSAVPTRFSNTSGSNTASVGAFVTAKIYQSGAGMLWKFAPESETQGLTKEQKKAKYKGIALRFKGLDSTNSNDYSRAIVFHGSYYREGGQTGRSYGCLSTSRAANASIIDFLGVGSFGYKFGGTSHNVFHGSRAVS